MARLFKAAVATFGRPRYLITDLSARVHQERFQKARLATRRQATVRLGQRYPLDDAAETPLEDLRRLPRVRKSDPSAATPFQIAFLNPNQGGFPVLAPQAAKRPLGAGAPQLSRRWIKSRRARSSTCVWGAQILPAIECRNSHAEPIRRRSSSHFRGTGAGRPVPKPPDWLQPESVAWAQRVGVHDATAQTPVSGVPESINTRANSRLIQIKWPADSADRTLRYHGAGGVSNPRRIVESHYSGILLRRSKTWS